MNYAEVRHMRSLIYETTKLVGQIAGQCIAHTRPAGQAREKDFGAKGKIITHPRVEQPVTTDRDYQLAGYLAGVGASKLFIAETRTDLRIPRIFGLGSHFRQPRMPGNERQLHTKLTCPSTSWSPNYKTNDFAITTRGRVLDYFIPITDIREVSTWRDTRAQREIGQNKLAIAGVFGAITGIDQSPNEQTAPNEAMVDSRGGQLLSQAEELYKLWEEVGPEHKNRLLLLPLAARVTLSGFQGRFIPLPEEQ